MWLPKARSNPQKRYKFRRSSSSRCIADISIQGVCFNLFWTTCIWILTCTYSRAPAPPELEKTESEAASLVDVDSPHVTSVKSDFESQVDKTETQVTRKEHEAEDKAREVAKEAKEKGQELKEKASAEASKAKSKMSEGKDKLQENQGQPSCHRQCGNSSYWDRSTCIWCIQETL